MAVPDRREQLQTQNAVTGIDFVYVHPNQVTLDVFFLRDPATLATPLVNDVDVDQIRIYSPSGGETLPTVPVASVAWAVSDARDVLRITTASPGDFSRYCLHIADARIDPYFNDTGFTFKANCPTELDCKPKGHVCPPEDEVDFPINYLARDFWSFRTALLDFASQRYPDWQDRLEADAGMMLLEVMSALGDEFAYYQDRIGREGHLETATQRRSLRRHARLVDYNVHDGLGSFTWLDFTVSPALAGTIPAGAQVWERRPTAIGGSTAERRAASRVVFEAGHGLVDTGNTFAVDAVRNEFLPHQWDEEDVCLVAQSTMLHIQGSHQADLPLDDFSDPARPGKWMLLRTTPTDASVQPRAFVVRVIEIVDMFDPVFAQNITRLTWEQPTPFELDKTVLVVRANIVPATVGETQTQLFMTGPQSASDDPPAAVERTGPDATTEYLYSLPGSEESGLAWTGASTDTPRPEIRLFDGNLVAGAFVPQNEWSWRRSLLGVNSSQPSDRDFVIDDGFWRRVVGYRRVGQEVIHEDYATNDGATIRFGDGQFGLTPAAQTAFQAIYRLFKSQFANVPAGVLTDFDVVALPFIDEVTNPVPAAGAIAAETPFEIKQLAPEAFRAITYRAVRHEDYAEAAERLPWVQKAGAEFRWTGSWLTAFVTPDPRGSTTVTRAQEQELFAQIDRFRQAGREAWTLDPIYANLDLEIKVCVASTSYAGEVKERVLEALFGKSGFFSPDNFTFGTPLWRSMLEAAIQRVEGVRAVQGMRIRRRGRTTWKNFTSLVFRVAGNELIRVMNDRELPERGSVRLVMEGGA